MELTIEQALQRGMAAHKEGKLQEAERLYRAILQSQPHHLDANHNLGVLLASVNKTELALPLFETALQANPEVEQFWLSYIRALIEEQQFEKAKEVIEQGEKKGLKGEQFESLKLLVIPASEKRSPPQSEINTLLGHYQSGRYDDAEKLAVSITRQFPEHQFSWKVLGILFGQKGSTAEALNANQNAVKLAPQDAEAHNNLAITLAELKRLDEAQASYKKAIELKSDFPEAYNNRGAVLLELNSLEDARFCFTRAIELKPEFAEAHNHLGLALKHLEQLEEGVESFRRAIALNPEYAAAHNNLGDSLKEIGRVEEAMESFRQALAIEPGLSEAHNNLGTALLGLGKTEEALESYKEALALNPNSVETLENTANLFSDKGEFATAIEFYQKALSVQSGSIKSLMHLDAVKAKAVPAWHLPMMNDLTRNNAYLKALESAIGGGELVLDIGTGSGLLSMMAADSGAGKVFTCEVSQTISQVAEKVIARNGYDSRVKVINKKSTDLIVGSDIEDKADVLVSEILSSEFVGEGVQQTILDAKKRLLKKNGKMIPESGFIMISLIENNSDLANEMFVDNSNGYDLSDFNSISQKKFVFSIQKEPVLLSEPIQTFGFDFCTQEKIQSGEKSIEIMATREGFCAGLVQWIKVRLFEDIVYENNPVEIFKSDVATGWRTPIYRFDKPLYVEKGQIINVKAALYEDEVWFHHTVTTDDS